MLLLALACHAVLTAFFRALAAYHVSAAEDRRAGSEGGAEDESAEEAGCQGGRKGRHRDRRLVFLRDIQGSTLAGWSLSATSKAAPSWSHAMRAHCTTVHSQGAGWGSPRGRRLDPGARDQRDSSDFGLHQPRGITAPPLWPGPAAFCAGRAAGRRSSRVARAAKLLWARALTRTWAQVRVWDLGSGECETVLRGKGPEMWAVAARGAVLWTGASRLSIRCYGLASPFEWRDPLRGLAQRAPPAAGGAARCSDGTGGHALGAPPGPLAMEARGIMLLAATADCRAGCYHRATLQLCRLMEGHRGAASRTPARPVRAAR